MNGQPCQKLATKIHAGYCSEFHRRSNPSGSASSTPSKHLKAKKHEEDSDVAPSSQQSEVVEPASDPTEAEVVGVSKAETATAP